MKLLGTKRDGLLKLKETICQPHGQVMSNALAQNIQNSHIHARDED